MLYLSDDLLLINVLLLYMLLISLWLIYHYPAVYLLAMLTLNFFFDIMGIFSLISERNMNFFRTRRVNRTSLIVVVLTMNLRWT